MGPENRKELRRHAEELLKSEPKADLEKFTIEDAERLIHELRVHQIELEMQNDELRRAQEELEASRSKYADLYDFAPVSYFVLDKNGLILEANLTAARLLGIERSHLIKKPFSSFVKKDDRDLFYLHCRKVFDASDRQTCEISLTKKDGTEFYAHMESIRVEDLPGNRSCRTSVIDISRRRQAEEALKKVYDKLEIRIQERTSELNTVNERLTREIAGHKRVEQDLRQSQRKLALHLEQTIFAVIEWDTAFRARYWNPAAERIFGYTKDEAIGQWGADLIIPADIRVDLDSVWKQLLARSGGTYNINENLTKDGRTIVCEWINTPLLDEKGSVTGVMSIANDITERRQAEKGRADYLLFLENLERIDLILRRETDLFNMMRSALDEMLLIFGSDRAWLIYPCDPEAPSWRVPMERTVPEYPGMFKAKLEMPMRQEEAGVFRKALETDAPVCFDPATEYVPPEPTREMFHIQSQIIIAIHVKVGKPWLLGMHQCSHPRVWNEQDRKLFTEISRRITDSLNSLLFFREVIRSEEQLRNAQKLSHVGSWELDLVHNRLDWNDETYHIFETDPQNFGATYEAFLQLVHPEDMDMVKQAYSDSLKNRTPYDIIHRLLFPDGRIKFVHERCETFYNEEGAPVYSVGAVQDITDRKKAEEIIKASLKEKDALLQEIHHRVKNNMQVISSLLSLQSAHIKDKDALESFRESQNRIKSMALVHEKLYMTDDMSKINFIDYIENIAHNLFKFYGISEERVALNIARDKVFLKIETAIPCGLIINELVSNSLKYAFPDNRKGEITLTLHSIAENTFELTVTDNGIGLPEDLDIRTAKSLGLKLVEILTGQIRGEMTLIREHGTKYKILFIETKKKKEYENA